MFAGPNTIGGAGLGQGNLISGNTGNAVDLTSPNNLVEGNTIGLNAAGAALSNGTGVRITATGNTVRTNTIASNSGNGVNVASGTRNAILSNQIRSNGALGINLGTAGVSPNDLGDGDTGANNLQNFPVLTAMAGGVQATLNSTANASFTVQFFGNAACDSSGNGEGETFLGAAAVTTNASGNVTVPLFSVSAGQIVSATATNTSTNDTSEFSACVTVPSAQADLSLTIRDPADPVPLGTNFNYVVEAHNAGPGAATGVVVTDALLGEVSVVSATSTVGTCSTVNLIVTCDIGTLAVNASATITIEVSSSVPGEVQSSASIAGAQTDPVPGNNSAAETTTIGLAVCTALGYAGPTAYALPSYGGYWTRHGDVNGDGAADLVTSIAETGLVVQINNGNGAFGAATSVLANTQTRGVTLADFNKDGKLDIAVLIDDSAAPSLMTLFGTGTGTFQPPVSYPTVIASPTDLAVSDLDNDGDLDIATANQNSDDVTIRFNAGDGTFPGSAIAYAVGHGPRSIAAADLDGDGDVDLLTANQVSGDVSILFNQLIP
jgi:uncharacterized repeat protein (TIGR01451 family)